MAVRERVAKGNIEGKLVADLPDQPDEPRNRFFHAELLLIKKLRDRPHLPFEWAFDDGANKSIGVMVSRQQRFDIEIDRSPIPALRDDTGGTPSSSRSSSGTNNDVRAPAAVRMRPIDR